VDEILVRKQAEVDAFLTSPGPANRQVQDEKLLGVDATAVRKVLRVVDEEVDAIRKPFDRVAVIVIPWRSNVELATDIVPFEVDGPEDRGRHEPHILHDVDLAVWPVGARTEGPYGRPSSTSGRKFCTHLDAAVSECEFALCGQAGRRDLVSLPRVS